MTTNIQARIRKLFALARDNASEEEAASALAKAADLMLQHGIDHVDDTDPETQTVLMGEWSSRPYHYRWPLIIRVGIAHLYDCRHLEERAGYGRFIGKRSNIEACEATLPLLLEQVEELCKFALETALSRNSIQPWEDTAFKTSFKNGCAIRVAHRCVEIKARQRNMIPQHMALVVIDESLAEADAILKKQGAKTSKAVTISRNDLGRAAGDVMGETVKIQDSVKAKANQPNALLK
jgi:hypothetical protein